MPKIKQCYRIFTFFKQREVRANILSFPNTYLWQTNEYKFIFLEHAMVTKLFNTLIASIYLWF